MDEKYIISLVSPANTGKTSTLVEVSEIITSKGGDFIDFNPRTKFNRIGLVTGFYSEGKGRLINIGLNTSGDCLYDVWFGLVTILSNDYGIDTILCATRTEKWLTKAIELIKRQQTLKNKKGIQPFDKSRLERAAKVLRDFAAPILFGHFCEIRPRHTLSTTGFEDIIVGGVDLKKESAHNVLNLMKNLS